MNYWVIIAIVVIIILLYILWNFFSNSGTKLVQNQNLNNIITTPISVSDTSTRYAYAVWIYVNSWNTSNGTNTIFSRSASATNRDTSYTTRLYLDASVPTLYLDISQNSANATKTSPIAISTNFPVQKWCHVSFSVDGQYVDCYMDGKLVKSVLLNAPIIASRSTDYVFVGNAAGINDIYLSGFYHWATPITPQDVWSKYLKGNGSNPLTNVTNSFGLGISIFKNNVENNTYRLF